MKTKQFLLLIVMLLQTLSIHAVSDELFKHLSIENGLAHTDANCLAQDSSGLIWIGTFAGLQSYDGYELRTFDYYADTNRVYRSHNRILSLSCDARRLWVGTESGLACLDLHTRRYIPIETNDEGLKALFSTSITRLRVQSSIQCLWYSTYSNTGVVRIDGDTIRPMHWHSEADRLLCKGIDDICFADDVAWANNGHLLLQIVEEQGKLRLRQRYTSRQLLGEDAYMQDFVIDDNYLYVRTEKGCYRFPFSVHGPDISQRLFVSYASLNATLSYLGNGLLILDKASGALWCSDHRGLFKISNPFSPSHASMQQHLQYNRLQGEALSKIKDLCIDSYGNLWIATASQGVFYRQLAPSPFRNLWNESFQDFGFKQNEIMALAEGTDGTVYMVVEHATLFSYRPDTGKLTKLLSVNSPYMSPVYCQALAVSHDNRHLYIGTNVGIFMYDIRRQMMLSDVSRLLPGRSIVCMIEDNQGSLWVATWGNGLYRIAHPLKSPLNTLELNTSSDPQLLSDNITYMHMRGDYVYLCTNNGLNRLRLTADGQIHSLASYQADDLHPASMSTNYIACVDCASDSVCWIGTIGGGVNQLILHSDRHNDYTAFCYLRKDGLQSNDCEIVLLDKQGDLWIGGNGLNRLSPSNKKIYSYGEADDLRHNAYKVNVSLKSRQQGLFYMGGIYGLNYFNPDEVVQDTLSFGLMLTELRVNNQSIVPGSEHDGRVLLTESLDRTQNIRLTYRQNNFAVSFAACGYNLSDRIMYRYRLKGFMEHWKVQPYTNNEAYFLNLPYGDYRLEVQYSSDRGNTWHEPGRTLAINLMAPWWLTVWAKTGYILLVIGILIIVFKQYAKDQRLKNENKIQKLQLLQDEEKYQAKMQFFMNASHELKTPLTLILLATDQMTNGTKKMTDGCKTILRHTRRMLALINELVDIRKTELGVGSLHKEQVHMSELVKQLYQEVLPWGENKQIGITYLPASTDEIVMDADRDKMEKLLVNLFSNAIKYTNPGGRIEIILKRGHLSEITPLYGHQYTEGSIDDSREACILIVRDTGVGISPESIRQIYERFFQVQSKTSMHLGTGIGLAIVKSIVLLHQGVIIVSSERMVGTEFIVALPISKECGVTKEVPVSLFDMDKFLEKHYSEYVPTETVSVDTQTECPDLPTMLIVEDNKELQTVLKQHFSTLYNIYVADDGQAGLEMVNTLYPDIIISDVMMPRMDGFEMCRHLKDNLSTACIPLIMLTAKDSLDSQIEGYESGADLYIPKPFSLRLLEVNAARLIRQREHWLQRQQKPLPAHLDTASANDTGDTTETKSGLNGQELEVAVAKLKQVIEENLDNAELSPNQIAAAMGMSRTKLYRDLKRIDGMSLADYVRNVRLEKAAELLVHGNLNVQEVMLEVGFVNSSHFSKVFKLKYGLSPTEYKKNTSTQE